MENKGQCYCGQVTFTVTGEPVRMAACHCNACRRLSGTGHLVQAFYKKDQVHIKGNTKSFDAPADSGNMRTRHFCPECGSRLFSENEKLPDIIGIAVGAFDNSDWFKPQIALYTSERPIWDYMDPELKTADHMT
ncbi:GFA family protein [Maritalea myrionectae]|uniref:GFA family protein n=1 Tax=Maritalea myrionectae TaxID=454601 RepID=UPI0004209E97|nr:GFA family protein [Maritalea myrionectae]